jgi:fluoroquinolone resistance protein
MASVFFEGKTFNKSDFTVNPPEKGEYDSCRFQNCDFSDVNLSGFVFTECEFVACNLSLAKLGKTALKDCRFKDCKMLGLHFEDCSDFLFQVGFDNCQLNLSSFFKRKLKQTTFRNTSLQEVDFTEADLTAAVFDQCDMTNATFDRSILEKADFRSAFNYSIDPENNRIKKAKFSVAGLPGLLYKYGIEIE